MNNERIKEIDDIVCSMLLDMGMTFPENTMGELLSKLGIPYAFEAPLPEGVSGIVIYDDKSKQYKIAVNKNDSRERRVFSLAHELGHYKLKHLDFNKAQNDVKFRMSLYNYDGPEKKQETEANYFAATLLVPEQKLRWALTQSIDTRVIAKYFGVSEAVIINRMNWLGL